MRPQKIGLILTGGGSRAAYQVGVLKAIAEFTPHGARSPFAIICGTSAGALNAATLAINAGNFRKGVKYLLNVWKNFHVAEVYRSDFVGVLRNTSRGLAGLILSSFGINRLNHVSLLDNAPLVELLEQTLPCEKIQESIDSGVLHALSITASGYGSGHSVTFYQGVEGIQPWRRARRLGVPTRIGIQHLLASAAIPFIFPAVHIHREHFGDGSMRQLSPISSALHLGADRVLVVGMGSGGNADAESARSRIDEYPSLAQIAGHALDSIFLDSMEVDLERLRRINRTVSMIPEDIRPGINLRHVDVLVISPSQPLEKIAERHLRGLPWTIRLLLRAVGVMRRRGANLVSYLLFEKTYCRALIDLGYQDAMKRKEEIVAFLGQGAHQSSDNNLPQ
ncbi:MAG: patatin-like phospholipase family protein [Gallionellaceae bacterium]|nr:MAG: patatin-like phospholipase family protein [Gallionellaceae bacterium]